jgi:hypothetical protein
MKRFTQTEFILLVKESSKRNIHLSVLESACDEFADSLFTESVGTSDRISFHQSLCYASAELTGLRSLLTGEPEKNTSLIVFIDKAAELLRTQIKFAEWQIKQAALLPGKRLKWTSSQMELVELVYALYEAKCFNGGEIYLKEVFSSINTLLDMNVKDFSLYFMSIKNRVKGDRTFFLDKLKQLLMKKMEEADRRK